MLAFMLLGAPALGATWTVGATGDFASLAEAVAGAADGDTLSLEAGTHAGCVDLGGRSLTLLGEAGSASTRVDGAGACEDALSALAGEALTIRGITLLNSGGRGLRLGGGATLNGEDLVISDAGAAGLNGGGLYADGGAVALRDSALTGNRGELGGNIFLTGGASLTLTEVELSLGTATNGGGLYVDTDELSSSLSFERVSVSANTASSAGAGLFLDRGTTLDSRESTYDANVGVTTHGVGIYGRSDVTIASVDDTFTLNAASDLASGYSGGAIYLGARAVLDVSGGLFQDNSAYEGGAIFQQTDGVITITDTLFSGNRSFENGGAVHGSDNLTLTLSLTDFDDNDADYGTGGAIEVHDVGELTVSDVDFSDNDAAEEGGAVYLDYAVNASFTRATFSRNTAGDGDGGALRHGFYGSLSVTECRFDQNTARDAGGAVYLDYLAAEAVFLDVVFADNTSERGDGGTLYAEDYGDLSLDGVQISGSSAAYDGGGLYASLWGDLEIARSRFEDNQTALGHGGGMYVAPATASAFDATLRDSTFTGNNAGRHGGGLYSYGVRAITLDEVSFTYNAADGDGPGLYHGGGAYLYLTKQATVTRSLFCANTATNGAGVFIGQLPAGTNVWTNNRFVENTASKLGGGVYFGSSKGGSFENNALLGNQATTGGGVYATGSTTAYVNNVVAWTVEGGGVYGNDAATAAGSTLSYSDWYENLSADVGGKLSLTLGSDGNISVDPGFEDYTLDGDCENDKLWLAEGSALADAGEPGRLDPDGSVSDLGPYGGAGALAPDRDADGAGTSDWGGDDCDDADGAVYPGADEVCDDKDNDCDGDTDEDAIDVGSWFADADADGYGDPTPVVGCDAPALSADNGEDCDDADATVYPGAAEVHGDGLDQDCDGLDRLSLDDLAYGDLALSEIMVDPSKVEDAVGEWFEVYNATDAQVDLAGLVLSDDDTDVYTVPGALLVDPGETALFAVRSDPTKNGGLPIPDHVWVRSGFRFDNVTDEIEIAYAGLLFDRVAWGVGRELSVVTGASLSLDIDRIHPDLNDAGYAWCTPTLAYGSGDLGSPDDANESCGISPLTPDDLTAGELVVTEVMVDPSKVDDALGEWIELYNDSGSLLDLNGLVLADEGTDRVVVAGSLLVEAGATVVLAVKSSPAVNGGNVEVDYAYARATFRLDNTADELLLQSAVGTTLDRVAWTAAWGVSPGLALSLDPTTWDAASNDDLSAWCEPTTTYGAGDRGTPGSDNDACASDADGDGATQDEDCDDEDASVYPGAPEVEGDGLDQDCDGYDQLGLGDLVAGDLVLSEVMANPAAVDDAVGEWFEVYNATPLTVNLDGLVLSDLGTDTVTVSGEVQVLPGAYALFAVKSLSSVNGGLPLVDHVWLRTPFRFDNGADEIALSYAGTELDYLAWGPTAGLLAASGASISLSADRLDATLNDDPAAWCAASASYGLGDLGTPGAGNGGCP